MEKIAAAILVFAGIYAGGTVLEATAVTAEAMMNKDATGLVGFLGVGLFLVGFIVGFIGLAELITNKKERVRQRNAGFGEEAERLS